MHNELFERWDKVLSKLARGVDDPRDKWDEIVKKAEMGMQYDCIYCGETQNTLQAHTECKVCKWHLETSIEVADLVVGRASRMGVKFDYSGHLDEMRKLIKTAMAALGEQSSNQESPDSSTPSETS